MLLQTEISPVQLIAKNLSCQWTMDHIENSSLVSSSVHVLSTPTQQNVTFVEHPSMAMATHSRLAASGGVESTISREEHALRVF